MLTDILLIRLERALAVADRGTNAVLHEREGRWTVQGDPTEGALLVVAPEHFSQPFAMRNHLGHVARQATPLIGMV